MTNKRHFRAHMDHYEGSGRLYPPELTLGLSIEAGEAESSYRVHVGTGLSTSMQYKKPQSHIEYLDMQPAFPNEAGKTEVTSVNHREKLAHYVLETAQTAEFHDTQDRSYQCAYPLGNLAGADWA